MGIDAAVQEISAERSSAEKRSQADERNLMWRLDSALDILEQLNLDEVEVVPQGVRTWIQEALVDIMDVDPEETRNPVDALNVIFAAETLVLRKTHPNAHPVDEIPDW